MTSANHQLSPPLQRWHRKGSVIPLLDHNIFYIDEGDPAQPAIVLIHGFPTSSYDFSQIWSALRQHHRLISIDMLGFGFSDKPNNRNYTLHKQADLFSAVLQQLGLSNYHLLAHDYGVSVAQELLARDASNTSAQCLSCCFLNGGLFPETHHALLVQKILLSRWGKYANLLLGYTMFKKSFSQVFGANTKPSETDLALFWEIINFNNGRHLFHNLITYIDDRRTHRERWLKALTESRVPLALINGSVDPVSGAHLVTRYKELGCRLDYLQEFEEIGHYPQVEDSSAVSQAYLEFLRRVG